MGAIAARARDSLDLTVPTGSRSSAATSSTGRSWTWCSSTTAREPMGNDARAAATSSRAGVGPAIVVSVPDARRPSPSVATFRRR